MGVIGSLFGSNKIQVWLSSMDPKYLGTGTDKCITSPSVDDLIKKNGDVIEVHADDDDEKASRVRIIFANGKEYFVVGNSRYILGGLKFGYSGTGPDLSIAFLNEIGFKVSSDDVKKMRIPFTLKKN
jgi:hypothetical protein